MDNKPERIKFLNTYIDNVTMSEAIDYIDALIQDKKPSYVVTPNVDHIVRIEKDKEFQKIYEEADLILTDGKPLLWIAKKLKTPIKEKVSGSDLFPELCKLAAQKGYRMFLLGAEEGVGAQAAKNLCEKNPGLEITGTYSPPFGFEKDSGELQRIETMIHESDSHILIIGLGCPKQEKLAHYFRDRLNVPVSLGLGASIDFEAGKVKRCPKWMSSCGLEWFYRLVKEPKRMFKRYLVDDMKIVGIYRKYR